MYDHLESQAEEASCRQIELDQELTSEDLYNIGMESDTAALKMRALCYRTGIQYPPQKQETALD